MLKLLVSTLILKNGIAFNGSFADFHLCRNLTDPNICLEGIFGFKSLECSSACCSIHDDKCTLISPSKQNVPALQPSTKSNANAMYHADQCIFESPNKLYDLYNLEINPYQEHSYNFSYGSTDTSNTSFHNQSISLFLNICNVSSVRNTQWNDPPNTLSLNQFLNSSMVVCGEYGDGQNTSALCTEFGSFQYQTSDFTKENNELLILNLGKSTCLYYKNPDVQIRKIVFTQLHIECDPDINDTEIYSVDGPIFSLDSSPSNYPCASDITIKMRGNKGACPRKKINATNSRIYCPRLFNQTTKSINCSLYTLTNDNGRIGDMNDIKNYYLSIYTLFGTQTQSILVTAGVNIACNETGVFNISLDMNEIAEWYDLTNDVKLWKNITIYAATNYSLGPNTTTPNETVLFLMVPDASKDEPSDSYVTGWVIGIILSFLLFCTVFRYAVFC